MAKSALGKGLNQLMGGQPVARKPAPADPAVEKVTPVDFGRGLNTLVASSAIDRAEAAPKKILLPTWFFFTADLLLLAYTVAICLDAAGPLERGEILFAFASTSLGALLGIIGVLRACGPSD